MIPAIMQRKSTLMAGSLAGLFIMAAAPAGGAGWTMEDVLEASQRTIVTDKPEYDAVGRLMRTDPDVNIYDTRCSVTLTEFQGFHLKAGYEHYEMATSAFHCDVNSGDTVMFIDTKPENAAFGEFQGELAHIGRVADIYRDPQKDTAIMLLDRQSATDIAPALYRTDIADALGRVPLDLSVKLIGYPYDTGRKTVNEDCVYRGGLDLITLKDGTAYRDQVLLGCFALGGNSGGPIGISLPGRAHEDLESFEYVGVLSSSNGYYYYEKQDADGMAKSFAAAAVMTSEDLRHIHFLEEDGKNEPKDICAVVSAQNGLRLRDEPGLDGLISAVLPAAANVSVVPGYSDDKGQAWSFVFADDGSAGYAASEYLNPVSCAFANGPS